MFQHRIIIVGCASGATVFGIEKHRALNEAVDLTFKIVYAQQYMHQIFKGIVVKEAFKLMKSMHIIVAVGYFDATLCVQCNLRDFIENN